MAALRRLNPAVPIIAVSGHTDSGKTAAIIKAGATMFLPKPYSAEVVLRALSDVLRGSL